LICLSNNNIKENKIEISEVKDLAQRSYGQGAQARIEGRVEREKIANSSRSLIENLSNLEQTTEQNSKTLSKNEFLKKNVELSLTYLIFFG